MRRHARFPAAPLAIAPLHGWLRRGTLLFLALPLLIFLGGFLRGT